MDSLFIQTENWFNN